VRTKVIFATVRGPGGPVARWSWEEFKALPHETVTTDIQMVEARHGLGRRLRRHPARRGPCARCEVRAVRARDLRWRLGVMTRLNG